MSSHAINALADEGVYLGKDGGHLVILLGGGTKKRQNRDIRTAQDLWTAYKARTQQEH